MPNVSRVLANKLFFKLMEVITMKNKKSRLYKSAIALLLVGQLTTMFPNFGSLKYGVADAATALKIWV
jgi:hypothetical protein